MTTNSAPYVKLTWTATALSASFGGYNVYRRPSRAVAGSWVQIGAITVPTNFTPATVEAQHNSFLDYEAGWSITNGQWMDGWDYAVTVVSSATHLESALSTVAARVQLTPDNNPWVVSNVYPFLNFPIASLQQLDSQDTPARSTYQIAGLDLQVARTMIELPARSWQVGMRVFSRLGEDPARTWRAAASLGTAFCVHGHYGDRLIGVLEAPQNIPHEDVGIWTLTGDVAETSRSTAGVSDYNTPAGIVTNGTSYASVANASTIDPGGGAAFTFFAVAQFSSTASKTALGRRAAGQGYSIETDGSGKLQAVVVGSGGTATMNDASGVYNDAPHSVIVVANSGASTMYRDAVSAATSATAFTGVTNALALGFGAKHDGSAGMTLSPGRAWGFYNRALTANEVTNLHNYLMGVPGFRAPAGAGVFIDLRDNRAWDGTQQIATVLDLSGNANNATLNSSPSTRGLPWNLAVLDKF